MPLSNPDLWRRLSDFDFDESGVSSGRRGLGIASHYTTLKKAVSKTSASARAPWGQPPRSLPKLNEIAASATFEQLTFWLTTRDKFSNHTHDAAPRH
jgi:hypothetical protein